jgi:RimJ/RimL family protein N-acetyltransferase
MLKGEKVTLRSIRKDDAKHWEKWLNDAEVLKYLEPYLLYGVNRESEEKRYDLTRRSQTNKYFTIETTDGQVIGITGLHAISWEWSNAEIGINIGEKEYWGKGCGTDAMRILVKFAFDRMNLHRVYLHVSALHQGGIRCYEKIGFKREGVLREDRYLDGKYHDTVVMGILRGELR